MRSWLVLIAVGAGLVHLAGCDGVGTTCNTAGATGECAAGLICTLTNSPDDPALSFQTARPPVLVCLRKCEKSMDCGDGEVCHVVPCSDLNSCQIAPPPLPPAELCMPPTGGTGGAGGTGGTAGTGGTGGSVMPACDSTANAFIKTIDPNNNFDQTNFEALDTTAISEDWMGYSIELLIDDGLVGQFLQVGFSATASNFEPSGVFYDNIVVDPGPEYTQDFESLDQASATALGDPPPAGAGFVVFGTVFSRTTGLVVESYGTFPAPNNTGAFSGIALGQGGPAQGDQVLVIISDYNNTAQQGAGNRVEGSTFLERTIVAGDVDNTITFSFDAKRGNINEGCPPRGTGGTGGAGGGGGIGGGGGGGGTGGG